MNLKHITNIFAIIFLGLIAVSIAYYLIIFLPSKEKMRNELEKEKIRLEIETNKEEENALKDKEVKLQKCLSEAKTEYQEDFILNSTEGKTPGGDEARSWNSSEARKNIEDDLQNNQDLCVKKYN